MQSYTNFSINGVYMQSYTNFSIKLMLHAVCIITILLMYNMGILKIYYYRQYCTIRFAVARDCMAYSNAINN